MQTHARCIPYQIKYGQALTYSVIILTSTWILHNSLVANSQPITLHLMCTSIKCTSCISASSVVESGPSTLQSYSMTNSAGSFLRRLRTVWRWLCSVWPWHPQVWSGYAVRFQYDLDVLRLRASGCCHCRFPHHPRPAHSSILGPKNVQWIIRCKIQSASGALRLYYGNILRALCSPSDDAGGHTIYQSNRYF